MRRQRENRITRLELFFIGRTEWKAPVLSETTYDGPGFQFFAMP
jgi:hypothetical protein